MVRKLNNFLWLFLSLLIIGGDQLTKHLVVTQFTLYEKKPITAYINVVLVHNYGAAFSFLNEAGGWQRWLFVSLSLIITLAMMVWLFSVNKSCYLVRFALALLIGGAIGNLVDRISQGYVVDFLDIYFSTYHWPAFNVADSAICIGTLLLMLIFWRLK